jgi:hypothetical protein
MVAVGRDSPGLGDQTVQDVEADRLLALVAGCAVIGTRAAGADSSSLGESSVGATSRDLLRLGWLLRLRFNVLSGNSALKTPARKQAWVSGLVGSQVTDRSTATVHCGPGLRPSSQGSDNEGSWPDGPVKNPAIGSKQLSSVQTKDLIGMAPRSD